MKCHLREFKLTSKLDRIDILGYKERHEKLSQFV